MDKKSLKSRGEDAAAAFLERVGICVVERGWKSEAGTIDIVAWDGDTLVLVDVKTRKRCHQEAGQVVSAASTRRIKRLAKSYLDYADLEKVAWRLDRIDLLVISEGRALLRHHRSVLSSTE